MVTGIFRDWLGITELQESQRIDSEQFQRLFSALKEWQEAQKIDAEKFEEVYSTLEKLQKGQQINAEQLEKVFDALEEKIGTEQFQLMQDHLNGLQEKVETLTETVADQEKIMLTCCIVASVIAVAATSFIGFCIYQGIKSEKEKQKNSSQSAPTGDLIDFGPTMPDTKLEVGNNTQELPKGPGLRAVD